MPSRRRVKNPKKLVQVHSRLFEASIIELKARAREQMVHWQTLLRLVLHEALMKKEEGPL